MQLDEKYMLEALHVAQHARGRTSPNPLVGAVLVKDGRIIASGWHRQTGTEHAEIHALRMAGKLAQGATLYVTLEPCAHYGHTGPCAKAVVEAGVSRVVIAMPDPNPLVAGKGIEILKQAGIEVACGILEEQAKRQNEVFLKWIMQKLPFVTLKLAMSLDGKIATVAGESKWITNEAARYKGHELRDEHDGILVGINTVLADNPSLTTRLKNGVGKNPCRIILDSFCRIPLDCIMLNDGLAPVIVAVSAKAEKGRIAALKEKGADVFVASDDNSVNLGQLMSYLAQKGICSLLVEGGGTVNYAFLEAGLVDKVQAFISPKLIGGRTALTGVGGRGFAELNEAVELENITTELLDDNIWLTAYVRK